MKNKKEWRCVSSQIPIEKYNKFKLILDKKCQNQNRVINRLVDMYIENPKIVEQEEK